MVTELNPTRFELEPIDGWPAGDSRTLEFTVVVDDNATPKDISQDDIRWFLLDKPYRSATESTLGPNSDGVDIITDQLVDPTAGEFRVDIAADATDGEWGDYWQLVVVDPPGDSQQTWQGRVLVSDAGD